MQTPPKASQRWRRFGFALAIAAAVGGSGAAYAVLRGPPANRASIVAAHGAPLPEPAPTQPAPPTMADFTGLAARTRPAVVSIATRLTPAASRHAIEQGQAADGSAPSPRKSRDAPAPAVEARGSGFIIDADGMIVTNNHVVAGGQRIIVTLDDGTRLPAAIVSRDRHRDIALLKINAGHPLPHLRFGNSRAVRPGAWVMAIGNPIGLGGTVTTGIVSGLQRRIAKDTADPFIQTDAPINRGSSGGPLLALDGTVVGMNTAILSPNGDWDGIGFAIPSNLIRHTVARLEAGARYTVTRQIQPPQAAPHAVAARRAGLGIALAPLSPGLRHMFGMPPRLRGAVVEDVRPGSLAEVAGLQPGDVIVGVDLHPVGSPAEAKRAVMSGLNGRRHAAALRIIREGRSLFVGIDRSGLG